MGKAAELLLQQVSCWHGSNQVVNNVSLSVRAGQHVALITDYMSAMNMNTFGVRMTE